MRAGNANTADQPARKLTEPLLSFELVAPSFRFPEVEPLNQTGYLFDLPPQIEVYPYDTNGNKWNDSYLVTCVRLEDGSVITGPFPFAMIHQQDENVGRKKENDPAVTTPTFYVGIDRTIETIGVDEVYRVASSQEFNWGNIIFNKRFIEIAKEHCEHSVTTK